MASLSTGAGPPVVNVYHEKSMILPDVSRVLTCLYEKNVKFETIKASYKDILSLQASRSVPVPFYDGPMFLQDSRTICRYLAETYEHQGYPFLLGKDVLERASIEQWLRNEEHAFDPPSRALFCHIAFPLHDDDDNDEDISREKRKLEEVLEVYEQRLGESDYLAGNKFTLADLVHLPGTHHVITSKRFAYMYDSRKNVQKWWNRVSARDSWQQVLRDMRAVEEEHRKEEHEKQQQQQWQTEYLPQFGVRDIHISPRQQEGTKSQTVLVAPPSTGTIITSIPAAPQEQENTSDHKPSSPIQRNQGGFFTTTEKPQPASRHADSTTQKPPSSAQSTKSSFFSQPSSPTTAKTHQRTEAEKPSHKDASPPSKTSPISPKEAPDKSHLSDFFTVSGYTDEAGSLAKPSPQTSSMIPGARKSSEAVAPENPSPGSAKSPHRITEPDYSESESKPFGVHPQPDTKNQQTPYGKPPDTSVGPEAGEKQKSASGTPYALGETAKQSTYTGSPASVKRPTEVDQDRAPPSPAQEVQAGVQHAQKKDKALPTNQKVSGESPMQVESEETQDGIDEGERFSTKRLRRMFNPDDPDSQDLAMEEEAPAIPKTHSDVHDREKQTTAVPANKMSNSPPTSTSIPYPETANERGALSQPNNDHATPGPEKTPRTDKLARTEGANMRAPQQTPTDAISGSALVQGVSPRSIMSGKALEATRKVSDSQGTSGSIQEANLDARGKQAPVGQEDNFSVRDISNHDTTKKSDATGKNETAKPSPSDPRSMLPTTPGKLEPSPDTQIHRTSGHMSKSSPPTSSLSKTTKEKTGIAETSQTSLISPNDRPGGQATRNAREPSSVPPPVKSQEDNNKTYKEEATTQERPRDQPRAQLAENKKQGDDAAPTTRIGKRKDEDSLENASGNKTGQAQGTTNDASSKLQTQSNQNRPQLSKDGLKQTKETPKSPTLSTSKEVIPSPPEKSKPEKQLQEDKSGIPLQDNAKQGSEASPLWSGTEQQKKNLSTNADNYEKTSEVNHEEKFPSGTQQVKNNRSDSKLDSSSIPTQFEGNKGNLPDSERRGS